MNPEIFYSSQCDGQKYIPEETYALKKDTVRPDNIWVYANMWRRNSRRYDFIGTVKCEKQPMKTFLATNHGYNVMAYDMDDLDLDTCDIQLINTIGHCGRLTLYQTEYYVGNITSLKIDDISLISCSKNAYNIGILDDDNFLKVAKRFYDNYQPLKTDEYTDDSKFEKMEALNKFLQTCPEYNYVATKNLETLQNYSVLMDKMSRFDFN